MEHGKPNGVPRQSTPRCQRTAKHANAARAHLSPAVVREAKNLQNFFPLPQRAEEEEVLEPNEEDEAENRKEDLPDEETDRHLGCCCCWWECCEKCRFFTDLQGGLSAETALRIASS